MSNIKELIEAAKIKNIELTVLADIDANNYISEVFEKFNPTKITEHLAIGHNSVSIPLDQYEFSYSMYLNNEPIYIFFEQTGEYKDKVVLLNNGKVLCDILENAFGMEYFVSNKNIDYLLAINWYVIEGTGIAKNWLLDLQ